MVAAAKARPSTHRVTEARARRVYVQPGCWSGRQGRRKATRGMPERQRESAGASGVEAAPGTREAKRTAGTTAAGLVSAPYLGGGESVLN